MVGLLDESCRSGSSTGKPTWPSKRGQKQKLKTRRPRGEETDDISGAYQAREGYMHSQASENWN